MSDQLAQVATSALVLVAVVILGLADVVDGEVVALAIGAVLPSPAGPMSRPLARRRGS